MSDVNVDVDFIEFIRRLKLDKEKSDVFMLDFEKTSPYYSGLAGVIMDIGYNFVDLRAAVTPDNLSRPPADFISDITAKVVYEVLRNPVFFNEMGQLKRMSVESNAFLYEYYELLVSQNWFSSDISEAQIAEEFRTFTYKAIADKTRSIKRQVDKHMSSMEYWGSTKAYAENPTSSPSAINREKAEMRYIRAKNNLEGLQQMIKKELSVEEMIKQGGRSVKRRVEKIQQNYENFLYMAQKSSNYQFDNSKGKGINYKQTWEQDKAVFDKIGYGGIVEPWEMIMNEMESKLESKKGTLLAVSAFGISSEKSNLETTSALLNTPRYSNFIDKYYNICMQNIVRRLKTADPEDILNLIHSKDPKAISNATKNLKETAIGGHISLQAHFRDVMEQPKYKQSHTGVKDAFDQSEAFIETIRRDLIPYFLQEGKW